MIKETPNFTRNAGISLLQDDPNREKLLKYILKHPLMKFIMFHYCIVSPHTNTLDSNSMSVPGSAIATVAVVMSSFVVNTAFLFLFCWHCCFKEDC